MSEEVLVFKGRYHIVFTGEACSLLLVVASQQRSGLLLSMEAPVVMCTGAELIPRCFN